MRNTLRVAAAVGIVCLLLLDTAALAQENGDEKPENAEITLSDLVQRVPGGDIDWGRQMLYAAGEGLMPDASKEPNRARAYLQAKDYAKMAAIANLMMTIEDATVTYEGSGREFMEQDDGLRKTIVGYVKNVEILRSETITQGSDKVVRVTVGTRLYGSATPGSAFLDKLARTEKPKQPPLIQIPLQRSDPRPARSGVVASGSRQWSGPATSRPVDLTTMPASSQQRSPYTSLVVDARGFSVPHAISPKIRKLNGDQIYGSVADKSEIALQNGTVDYVRTPERAGESERCGKSPLVVTAIGRGGGRSMCDVIIADDVARLVVEENAKSKFLDELKVIFVVDPPGSALGTALSHAPESTGERIARLR